MAAVWIRGFSRAGPVTISVAGRHERSQAPEAPPSQSPLLPIAWLHRAITVFILWYGIPARRVFAILALA